MKIKNLILILLSSILLTGCNTQRQKDTIVFSSWGSVSEVRILKKIISDFEEENKNTKIEFLHIPQNYFQKLHLLFASKTAPDVVFLNNLYLPNYENYLEDLSQYINPKEFYPQTISGMTINNKILAIPRDISHLVVYVNTDKMNLPPSNWNINQLVAEGKKAENPTYGIGAEQDIYWASPYLSYFGGGIVNNEGQCIINTVKSQDGLKFYTDLYNKYKIAPTKSEIGSSTLAQMFLDEKLLMYVSGRWMYPKINETAKFNWAVINFPIGETPINSDVSGWAISKQSKNKDLSVKFVKYLSSEKSAKYFATTGLLVPARIKIAQALNSNKHNEKVFLEVIQNSKNTSVTKTYKKITDEINYKYFN